MYYLLSTVNEETDTAIDEDESRTKLDSHANMPVVGRHAYIISDTRRIADDNPITPDYNSIQVNIVDAAVRYECPYNGEICISYCQYVYFTIVWAFVLHCGIKQY